MMPRRRRDGAGRCGARRRTAQGAREFGRAFGDRGSVTAELAVALPAVVAVVALAAGALSCAAVQVRLQDGAADAARLVARGDGDRAGAAVSVAVAGASHSVAESGDAVCVTAEATAAFGPVSIPLSARSCALAGGL